MKNANSSGNAVNLREFIAERGATAGGFCDEGNSVSYFRGVKTGR